MNRLNTFNAALEHVEKLCSRCGKIKHPTKGYLRLLKQAGELYVCQTCRESSEPPPIRLGSLGILR